MQEVALYVPLSPINIFDTEDTETHPSPESRFGRD